MADDNYEVGYGKPPQNNRFVKGRSGNPKGRPRGSVNHATLFRKIEREKIVVKEGTKSKAMTRLEIVFRQLWNKAAAGDMRASQETLKLCGVYAESEIGAHESFEDDSLKRQILENLLKQHLPAKNGLPTDEAPAPRSKQTQEGQSNSATERPRNVIS